MGYRIDNKDIEITGKRLTKIANEATGDVYKYKNNAIKVFKDGKEAPLDVQTANYLSTISTNRILLPRKLLFYNNAFKGFTYKLVSKKGTGKRMIMLPKDEFIGNIVVLERDIETLSHKRVLLNGIEPKNSIFNGNLYLTDPSKYTVLDLYSAKELEILNKYQLHLLLTSLIISELKKINSSSKEEKEIKEIMELKDSSENSSDFFNYILDDDDTIKQFIKRM